MSSWHHRPIHSSLGTGFRGGKRTEMIYRPVGKHGAAIDESALDGTEHARVVGADAVVAHNEITIPGDANRSEVAQVFILRGYVRFLNGAAIHVNNALADFDFLAGQTDDSFDEGFRAVQGIPENDDVAALDGLEAVDKLVDEDTLLVRKKRGHAGAFHFHGLIKKNDDDQGEPNGDEKVASPNPDLHSQGMGRGRPRRCAGLDGRRWNLVLIRGLHFCAAYYL